MKYFSEHCPMWEGMALSVAYDKTLFEAQSDFQHIAVYQTLTYGNMLVLDGKIQCTERDEWAYHRVLVHAALAACEKPKRVLIIGGGDGAALREVLTYPSVETVLMCEIDPMVIEVAKKYFPKMSAQMNNPRAQIITEDAIVYLKNSQEKFDAIIVDSSDPFGPAEALFESPFYATIKTALNENGVVSAQSGHFMIHEPTVEQLKQAMLTHFKYYNTLFAFVPSYPGGGVDIAVASDRARILELKNPIRKN